MDQSTAHFDLVKLQNQKIIRNLLRKEKPQSISALASKASLTYPTVAALLKELNDKGEVIQDQNPQSSGGRPGVRYELDIRFQYGLVVYLKESTMIAKVYNVYGQFVEEFSFMISSDITVDSVESFVDTILKKYSRITAISIGIPGVVYKNEILFLPVFPNLVGTALGETLTKQFEVEVFIENDLNAISVAQIRGKESFAHIAYMKQCIGTGIVLNGEIYTGSKGYAGELEYMCENIQDEEQSLTTCILALTCVLNLPLIYISGEYCREDTISGIIEKLSKLLPENRIPEIQLVKELELKYEEGLFRRILLYWENTI